ncbi:MAG: helix-turn-helix transcriptional regulator [Bacillota bacterium]|jgi:putative molybdopterin biosynthesis protein
MPENKSYTPDEVAQILKVSRFTIYEMIKRGELPAFHVGRKVRVEQQDLERYKQRSKGGGFVSLQSVGGSIQNAAPAVTPETMIICGQEPVLDILTRHLEQQFPQLNFLRKYVGSMAGLLALYQGSANLATAHLWDSDSDDYNLPYIRRLLPGHPTCVYNLVYRMAGFYVGKGNPKSIHSWQDLARPDLRLVNREHGSGARVLLDEQLYRHRLDRNQIAGYEHMVTSHLEVASVVARGAADVGVGIEKAASQVPEIEFIPLKRERYDLVIRKEDLILPHFQAVLDLLQSPNFRTEIKGIGGYDISQMGQLLSQPKSTKKA